jgi:stage IV sporulation protein A
VLNEFPIAEICFDVPSWISALDSMHPIKTSIRENISQIAQSVRRIGDIKTSLTKFEDNEYIENYTVADIDLGTGSAKIGLSFSDELYYSVLSELTGFEIDNESELISLMQELSQMKIQYERVSEALNMAEEKGYGIVMPRKEELKLEEPEIIKQNGGYGVKLSASAESIHLIRANIKTEINPIVGTEQQSEEMVKYMLKEFEADPQKLWNSNMFGKTLYELINEAKKI